MFKKGLIIVREYEDWTPVDEKGMTPRQKQRVQKRRLKAEIKVYHEDIIKDGFGMLVRGSWNRQSR